MATTKDDILDAISNMTVIELKELLDAFEEKFDVTAAAPVAVAAVAGGGAAQRRAGGCSPQGTPGRHTGLGAGVHMVNK